MMSFQKTKWVPVVGLSILLSTGCAPENKLADKAKLATALTLANESPLSLDQAIQVCSTQKTLLVSVKVGAGKGDTFDSKSSEFLVSEIPDGEKASDPLHDPSTCPFCRKKAESAPTVVVRMMDSKGKTFPSSAEKLFDLKRGMHIVVKGTGVFDTELNTFTIDATGLAKL